MIGCKGYFEKVPFETFRTDCAKIPEMQSLCEDDAAFNRRIQGSYDEFRLPARATPGSAGYDFFIPFDVTIQPGGSATIPTGVRIVMPESAVLLLVPRSGSGFKYGVSLANTVGVIDSDYYNPSTGSEGHIMVKLFNHDHHEAVTFHFNDGFVQGIIVPYSTLPEYDNENVELYGVEERTGGFGSTSKEGGEPDDNH